MLLLSAGAAGAEPRSGRSRAAAAHVDVAPAQARRDGNRSETVVVFVGDVMMAHGLKPVIAEKGADHPFAKVRPLLKSADIVFGNLENPIGTEGERFPDKDFHFLMDPPHAAALKKAGFRVMSLANNHILDFGEAALRQTLAALKTHGIAACGAGATVEEARAPAVAGPPGREVAFLAYSRTFPIAFSADRGKPGSAFADEVFIREDIARARKKARWVVVSVHWGQEYVDAPTPGQRPLARAIIDAGADAVIGHHPHMPQGLELYRGKIIAYSLGNFVFGTRNNKATEGLLLKVRFDTERPPQGEVVPILVQSARTGYQPRPLTHAARGRALSRLKVLCANLGTTLRLRKGRALLP